MNDLSQQDLRIRGIQYEPREEDAREIANEVLHEWGARIGVVPEDLVAPFGELVVAAVYMGLIAGEARTIMRSQDDGSSAHDDYMQGVEAGKTIEKRRLYGYGNEN